jgi:hypothetical protein
VRIKKSTSKKDYIYDGIYIKQEMLLYNIVFNVTYNFFLAYTKNCDRQVVPNLTLTFSKSFHDLADEINIEIVMLSRAIEESKGGDYVNTFNCQIG